MSRSGLHNLWRPDALVSLVVQLAAMLCVGLSLVLWLPWLRCNFGAGGGRDNEEPKAKDEADNENPSGGKTGNSKGPESSEAMGVHGTGAMFHVELTVAVPMLFVVGAGVERRCYYSCIAAG